MENIFLDILTRRSQFTETDSSDATQRFRGRFSFLLIATWAADVFAFFVGVRWGKRRLIPHVSPGKSVEGWLGGLVGAAVVTAAAAYFLVPEFLHPLEAVLIGTLIGVAGPLGDLFESMVKRTFGAKDSSRIIPGHGGVLDRIDSLLFTVPLAHVLFTLLGRSG